MKPCGFPHIFQCVGVQLRRERIAERMKALQELVPNANKVSETSRLSSSRFRLFLTLSALSKAKQEAFLP